MHEVEAAIQEDPDLGTSQTGGPLGTLDMGRICTVYLYIYIYRHVCMYIHIIHEHVTGVYP